MRANQSSTVAGKSSFFGILTPPASTDAGLTSLRIDDLAQLPGSGQGPCPTANHGEGLLHDVRNLVGAIGLYCDLLAMPGVLKPEHSQYSEELRLLGARSGAMIDSLMRSVLARESWNEPCPVAASNRTAADGAAADRLGGDGVVRRASIPARPVELRKIVEKCSGLLRRVANGRTLAVEFGPAAGAPVRVSEESVERILVNLVRNSAAAMDADAERSDAKRGAIRIKLGMMASRVGELRPWPFQHVRLSVEDCGCGMSPRQVERLMSGLRSPSSGSHGIGFSVVRDLAAGSGGNLQVVSAEGAGTQVQIEWPVATLSARDMDAPRVRLKPPARTARVRRLGDGVEQIHMEGSC